MDKLTNRIIRFTPVIGVFLFVLGAMLATVSEYGTSVPFYDEWEAEAQFLYKNYSEGNLSISDLFEPHNGHRIVLTRAIALALYIVNAGWDPILQMIVNIFLHASLAAVLVNLLRTSLSEVSNSISVLATGVVFALPLSWMSILVAFQTQFYFMTLFSVSAIWAFSREKYIAGYLFATISIFSMTSGAFVLPAFCAMLMVEMIKEKTLPREKVFHLIVSIFLFIAVVVSLPSSPDAQAYYSQNIKDFIITLVATLSWPIRIGLGVGMLINIPMAILVCVAFTKKRVPNILIGLVAFVALQYLAMAIFRGAGGVPPANRYWEIMILGIWLNFSSLLYILHTLKMRSVRYLAIVWGIVSILGIVNLTYQALNSGLPERKEQSLIAKQLIKEYINSNDESVFSGYSSLEISHPNLDALVDIISDQTVKSNLPSEFGISKRDRLENAKKMLLSMKWLFMLSGGILVAASLVFGSKRPIGNGH